MRRSCLILAAFLVAVMPLVAQSPALSTGPRELGLAVLMEMSIREGNVVIRVGSGGCTNAGSFRVDVTRENPAAGGVPNYRLSIVRVLVDDCKALLLDGVEVVFDLSKDLHLSGAYTVTVANPVAVPGGKTP